MVLIERKVKELLSLYRDKTDRTGKLEVGVLMSGGVDSCVLFHILNKLKEELNIKVTILHVAFDDFKSHIKATKLVRNLASASGCSVIVKPSTITETTSVKTRARQELKSISFSLECDIVLTGHHLDDHIETILLRMLRGTGVEGLKAIEALSEYVEKDQTRTFGKPFISTSKEDILQYAVDNSISYINDETNSVADNNRNFLRLEVIPLLQKRFNLQNLVTMSNTVKDFLDVKSNSNTLDIYSGKWSLNDMLNLPIGTRVFVLKEHFRVVYGFNFNKRIYIVLKQKLSEDISNLDVIVFKGIRVKKKDEYIVVEETI